MSLAQARPEDGDGRPEFAGGAAISSWSDGFGLLTALHDPSGEVRRRGASDHSHQAPDRFSPPSTSETDPDVELLTPDAQLVEQDGERRLELVPYGRVDGLAVSRRRPRGCAARLRRRRAPRAPIGPRIRRRSACAQAAPNMPVEPPITSTGLPCSGLPSNGREIQSSTFFSCPGTDALYSGVAISTASASRIASPSASIEAGEIALAILVEGRDVVQAPAPRRPRCRPAGLARRLRAAAGCASPRAGCRRGRAGASVSPAAGAAARRGR